MRDWLKGFFVIEINFSKFFILNLFIKSFLGGGCNSSFFYGVIWVFKSDFDFISVVFYLFFVFFVYGVDGKGGLCWCLCVNKF